MDPSPPDPHRLRPLQLLAAAALSAALMAGGLVLTGDAARARALLPTARPSSAGLLAPLPGSDVRWQEVQLNGRPTQVRVCRASGVSLATLLKRYEAVAQREAPPQTPYLVQQGPAAGAVLWSGADGRQRAVLAEAHPGGVLYRLLVDAQPGPWQGGDGPPPGGVRFDLPAAFSCARPDGTGLTLLDAPLAPADAADRAVERLRAAGYALERRGGSGDRVAATLRHLRGGLGAQVMASPSPDGARVSVTFSRRER